MSFHLSLSSVLLLLRVVHVPGVTGFADLDDPQFVDEEPKDEKTRESTESGMDCV